MAAGLLSRTANCLAGSRPGIDRRKDIEASRISPRSETRRRRARHSRGATPSNHGPGAACVREKVGRKKLAGDVVFPLRTGGSVLFWTAALFRRFLCASSSTKSGGKAPQSKDQTLIMDHFHYRNRILYCEEVAVPALAERYGTPLYVYSKGTLLHHLGQLKRAFAE